MSVQTIHEQVPDSDLATIYRNTNRLVDEGIVSELRIKKGESLYEVNKDDHQHAFCKICGKVKHIDIDAGKVFKDLKIEGFEVEDIEITIKGHCKK